MGLRKACGPTAKPTTVYNPPVNDYETSARRAAVELVRVLRDAGQMAYFAGGCVRDALLGKSPQDYDVATDAKPDRVRELFKHSRYVGEAFGVVLVSLLGDKQPATWQGEAHPTARDGRWIHTIEVATFRTEWGYADGRRPTGVAFSDAENDARRRDFTINGLFEDPLAASHEQRIIDHVGGVADLKGRILRAIGDADERFGEDYLRLLRAVRFAARLDFRLEAKTKLAILRHAPQLSRISRERIGQEVQAMLTGPRPARCVRLMQRLTLDGPTLNEASQRWPVMTVVRMSRISKQETIAYPAMLAAWIIDRHVHSTGLAAISLDVFSHHTLPAMLTRWRGALCLANEERDALKHTLAALPEALLWPELRVAKRKRLLARSTWASTWALLRSLQWVGAVMPIVEQIAKDAPPLFAEGVAPEPLVTGDDLIAIGLRPGRAIGKMLEEIYDAQLENAVKTREQALETARSAL